MIIWFGSTEKEQQTKVRDELCEIVNRHIKKWEDKHDYDKFYIKDIEKEAKKLFTEIDEQYEIDDKSNPRPQRYFRFTSMRIAQNYDTLFISWIFWHINSQHWFSPDWMALMEEYITFSFNYDDYDWLKCF
jgi:hypothetical protein